MDEIIIPHGSESNSGTIQPNSNVSSSDSFKSKNKSKPQNKKTTVSTTTPDYADDTDEKPCKGECVAGLFALFCDDIDSDAFCPGEASCCVKSDGNDSNDVAESSTKLTSTAPPRTKPTTKPTKVKNI